MAVSHQQQSASQPAEALNPYIESSQHHSAGPSHLPCFGPDYGCASDQAFGVNSSWNQVITPVVKAANLAGAVYGLGPLGETATEGDVMMLAVGAIATRPLKAVTLKLPFPDQALVLKRLLAEPLAPETAPEAYKKLFLKMIELRNSDSLTVHAYQSLFAGVSILFRAWRTRRTGWGELSLNEGLQLQRMMGEMGGNAWKALEPLVKAFEQSLSRR